MRIVEGKTLFLTENEFNDMVNKTAREISSISIMDEREEYDIVDIKSEGSALSDISNCVITDVPTIRKDQTTYKKFIENCRDVDKDFYSLNLIEVVAGIAYLGNIPEDIETIIIHLEL